MQFYNDQEVLSQNKTSSVVLPIAKVYLYFALALIISALAAFTFLRTSSCALACAFPRKNIPFAIDKSCQNL